MADPKDAQSEPKEKNVTMTQDQFNTLMERINNLENEKEKTQLREQSSQPQVGANGQVNTLVERHPVDESLYENPIEELYDLPELRRYAMRENYVIEYTCTPVRYQTAFGTWFTEPRFEIKLLQKRFDEDGKELVKVGKDGKTFNPRIIRGRASFFVDPPANIIEAELAGISPRDFDEGTLDKKMRMFRYKTWLLETLNPKRPQSTSNDVGYEVIGGKSYEIENSSKPV